MSEPNCQELLDTFNSCKHEDGSLAIYTAEQLITRVEGVLSLHTPKWHQDVGRMCEACGDDWPCPTRRRLDGEKP